jgi:hypothetical protein
VLITVPDWAGIRFGGEDRAAWCAVARVFRVVSARLVHALSSVVSGARKWGRWIVFRRVGLTSSRLEPACSTGGRNVPMRTVTPRASFLSWVLVQTACGPPPSVHEATVSKARQRGRQLTAR